MGIPMQPPEAEVIIAILQYLLDVIVAAEVQIYQLEDFISFAARACQQAGLQRRADSLVALLPRDSRLVCHVYREPVHQLDDHDSEAPYVDGPGVQL